MQKKACVHYVVSGKVQGVWFRLGTQDKAKELGVTGWVRNLPKGGVELIACGDETQLASLYEWLKKGPELANVTNVTQEQVPWQEHTRFAIK